VVFTVGDRIRSGFDLQHLPWRTGSRTACGLEWSGGHALPVVVEA